jgi:hypothetical protein
MNIEELEAAVAHLPPSDLARFSQWFEEFMAEQWDKRIESDILAGRLDVAGKRVAALRFESFRLVRVVVPLPPTAR